MKPILGFSFKVIVLGDLRRAAAEILRRAVPRTRMGWGSLHTEVPDPSAPPPASRRVRLTVWSDPECELYSKYSHTRPYWPPFFYRGTHGAVLVFDISDGASLGRVHWWRGRMIEFVGAVPVVLLGIEPAATEAVVSPIEISATAEALRCHCFVATPRSHLQVARAFETLASMVLYPTARVGRFQASI